MLKFKPTRRSKSLFLFQAEETQRPGILLYITLLGGNGGWQFQWPSTGDVYYRIVLQGEQIDSVLDNGTGLQTYVFRGIGFINYPPPLEIVPGSAGQAPSEINRPFLLIQWYGESDAAYYQVQERVGGNWQLWFQTAETGAQVYSWQSSLLTDLSAHNYQVLAYNSIGQAGTPVPFNILVVTPPSFVDPNYNVTYTGSQIQFGLAS
jgi:hypothetical protein